MYCAAVSFGEGSLARQEDGDVVQLLSVRDLSGEAFGRVGNLGDRLPEGGHNMSVEGPQELCKAERDCSHESSCGSGMRTAWLSRTMREERAHRARTWHDVSEHAELLGSPERVVGATEGVEGRKAVEAMKSIAARAANSQVLPRSPSAHNARSAHAGRPCS